MRGLGWTHNGAKCLWQLGRCAADGGRVSRADRRTELTDPAGLRPLRLSHTLVRPRDCDQRLLRNRETFLSGLWWTNYGLTCIWRSGFWDTYVRTGDLRARGYCVLGSSDKLFLPLVPFLFCF